ncbi:MAG: M14 family zinc carboxypeptidase [Bacteroidales bacterium]|jgi:hypothetical protein|nr:M14 family zinc carboxypeptidase [Bacteroidales bacterium]
MRAFLLATAFLLLSLTTIAGRDKGDTLLLKEYISKYGQAEVVIDYHGREFASAIGRVVSIDRYREGKLYLVINNLTISDFIRMAVPFDLSEPCSGEGIVTAGGAAKAMEWQSYPTYTQYDSIMRQFPAAYPGLCRLDTIGTSINGKLILVLKISDNVHVEEDDEPEVFYSSTMHGDELAGFVLMMRLADYLLENYVADSRIRNLVDNLQIYINPLANPDGTYRTGDIISNPVRANANGVDLNRNFPDPAYPSMVQEKENVDMIAFMRRHRFVLSANFHSGAEVVNYPWDRWTRLHADDAWFLDLSRAYADTVHIYAPDDYLSDYYDGVVRGSEWYLINGGRQDFVTWGLQGREVTIEIHSVKQTPAGSLETLWQYNYRSLVNYLSFALHGIRGRVTSVNDGEPLFARISVSGHDKDSSAVYSSPGGWYGRMIEDGNWTLVFSSPGYRDTVITGVESIPGETTWLDVAMEPFSTGDDTARKDQIIIKPNPSDGMFTLSLPDIYDGYVKIEIVSGMGSLLLSGTRQYSAGVPVTFDLSGYAAGIYNMRVRSLHTGRLAFSRVVIVR